MRHLALALVFFLGCAAPTPGGLTGDGLRAVVVLVPPLVDAGTDDAGPRDAGTADAGPQGGGTIDAGAPWVIAMRVVTEALGTVRAFVLIERNGADVALLVDTGSQITFLTTPPGSPNYTPDAGMISLGGRARAVPGRPFSFAETIDGKPVVGILGTDFFLEQPATNMDLVAQELRRDDSPWDAGGWTGLPFTNRIGYLYVDAKFDQRDVHLAFDTGAAHALILDAGPLPGDIPVQTEDAYGNPLTFYLGTTSLSWDGGAPRSVPIFRAMRFPTFEDTNAIVGGPPIHGIFGLTSMGGGTVRIDSARSTIWMR